MDRQHYHKKGFILLDLLVVLIIMGGLELLLVPKFNKIDTAGYNFTNEYLLNQTLALKNASKQYFDTSKYQINANISFNQAGNVNQAQTIFLNHKQAVITLGMGRIHLEE